LELRINGQVIEPSLSFPSTGYWTTWRYNTLSGITLQAGTNTIRTTAIGSSGANIDHLKVSESHLHINFQPSGKWIPSGYLPDYGEIYADRGNGNSYGWDIDITADMRDRNAITDQKWDTLAHMQKAGNRTWEMSLSNGTYDLVIGCGDPSNADFINNLDVEGTVITDPDPYDNFDEYNLTVSVTDGRLTITTAAGAVNVKICFVEIEEAGGEDTIPPTPDPMTWATVPYATGSTSIAMDATPASDPSGVQYYFTCTAGGGNDSGWQASPTYEDTGLSPDTTYTYTVKARDLSPNQNETAPSTAESATTLPTGTTDDVTNGETTIAGTVTNGSYLDTQSSDNAYEAIQEIESGGNPNKRRSYLEHKWTINVTGGDSITFFVEAYHTANSEGDDFIFAYSTDDISYTNMVVVTKTADDDNQQSFVLPSSISGTVYIRVTDSDQTQGNKALDTVYVDHMFIRSETGGGPCTPTDCHVQSIVCDTAPGSKGKKFGQVTVTIYDDCGNPVVGADVDGTFTGDFNETIYDITTNGNGQAVFTTSTQVKNPSYQFCVDDVTHGTLPYDSGDNVETCDSN
jgi:hypothetical protein